MIDTIKLTLQDWRVRPDADLKVMGGEYDYRTGETRQAKLFNGVLGTKAYLNTEKWNLSIVPKGGDVKAFISFSAPKQINTDNYLPLDEREFYQALECVEAELADNGIETDIKHANLSRLDVFKNILTDEETITYSPLLSLLNANRTKDRSTHGATTWLMRNRSVEYCIYDKLEEMQSTGHLTDGLPKTLRFEHRCKTSAKVKNFYRDVVSVEDLKRYGWNAIYDRTMRSWDDNFFKYDVDDVDVLVESEVRRELEFFKVKYGKHFFSRYLKTYGAYALTSRAGGVDVIKKTLELMDIGDKRKRIYRAERDLLEGFLLMQDLNCSPKSIKTLYSELKCKVLA